MIFQTLSTGHCSLNYTAEQIGMHHEAVQKPLLKVNLLWLSILATIL